MPDDIRVDWDEAALHDLTHNPDGELGQTAMRTIGEVVTAGAKRRALKRTGRMRDEIHYEVGADEYGLYADIISPATNPDDGFPYPLMHERSGKVRDRRPHRSLRPALKDVKLLDGRDV